MEEVKENSKNTTSERIGFSTTSLVLGIISVAFFWIWSGCVSLPSGIMAIICSVAGRKEEKKGIGLAGLAFGVLGLILCAIIYVLALAYGVDMLGNPIQ